MDTQTWTTSKLRKSAMAASAMRMIQVTEQDANQVAAAGDSQIGHGPQAQDRSGVTRCTSVAAAAGLRGGRG
ncbi:hypothetical protein [Streptomyces sp. NPDC001970]